MSDLQTARPCEDLYQSATNGFSTAYAAVRVDAAIYATFPHVRTHTTGAVYREDGMLMPYSVRSGGHCGDHVTSLDPENVNRVNSALVRYEGRTLYLGNFMSHYGHFITEFLSKCWIFDKATEFDHIVCQPFIFNERSVQIHEYHRHMLQLIGLPVERFCFVWAPAEYADVTIPKQLWTINVGCDLAARPVYAKIRAAHTGRISPKRVFLSRRPGLASRVDDASPVESLFLSRGFKVFYPEEIPTREQLDIYVNCDVLAGFSGSALHNCLFAKSSAAVIDVGDKRTPRGHHPMQAICHSVAGLRAYHLAQDELLDRGLSGILRQIDAVM